MRNAKRIGLFGGTFDPWTKAHSAIVTAAVEQDLVDVVVVIPTIVGYHRNGKKRWLTDRQRLDVASSFVGRLPVYAIVDGAEINSKIEGKISKKDAENWRFIDTLNRCIDKYNFSELYTIIGTDSLKNFKTWHKWEEILRKSRLIVVEGRNNEHVDTDIDYIPMNIPGEYSEVSSTEIRRKFKNLDEYIKSEQWETK